MVYIYLAIAVAVIVIGLTILAFIGLKSQREERAFKEKFGITENIVVKKPPKRNFFKYSRKKFAKAPPTHRK